MDAKPTPQNIQDAFLNTARRERTTVTIYLMHGTKLTGRIKSFDKFSVLLESGSQDLLIFKHAISTMSYPKRGSGELRVTGELRGVVDPSHSSGSESKSLTPQSGSE